MLLKNINYFFVIVIITIIAHFIPFERASLAPDDYAFYKHYNLWIKNFIYYPDRPLQFLWYEIQNLFINENTSIAFSYLIIANIIFSIICFCFINFFFNKQTSFLIIIINILLFNKLEIYHNAIMIHILIVSTLYLISLFLLINYLNNKNKNYLILSLIIYTISIFWYEIGFFLPLIIFFYNYKNKKLTFNFRLFDYFYNKLIMFSPFLLIMFFYLMLRVTNIFGYAMADESHSLIYNPFLGIYDISQHYFGRYAIKNIIYGILQFQKLNFIYIIFFAIANLSFGIFIFMYLKKNKQILIKYENFTFFILLFLFSLIPMILNGQSGGRNLLLATISISVFIYYFIFSIKRYQNVIFSFLVISLLFISEGNSWSQVQASKIQSKILNAILQNKEKIETSKYLIFNTKSLSENIKYSLVDNDYNLFNTYFGAQVWEVWGLKGFLNKNKIKINLIIINENPIINNKSFTLNKVVDVNNYKVIVEKMDVSLDDIFILEYKNIFKNNEEK